jgi:hypothetical protein
MYGKKRGSSKLAKMHQTYKPARKEVGERLVTQNTMLSNHDASKRGYLM